MLTAAVAAKVTGAGQGFQLGTIPTVDTITGGVAAGGLSVPQLSGIATNGGDIVIGSVGSITIQLNQPVNANNFVAGLPSTVLQASPGTVGLIGQGAIDQSSSGVILGSQLGIEVNATVTLTAANRIGGNDVSGVATTSGVATLIMGSTALSVYATTCALTHGRHLHRTDPVNTGGHHFLRASDRVANRVPIAAHGQPADFCNWRNAQRRTTWRSTPPLYAGPAAR